MRRLNALRLSTRWLFGASRLLNQRLQPTAARCASAPPPPRLIRSALDGEGDAKNGNQMVI
jgi:hypothetical protein